MKLWKILMKTGHILGCHQMPERSFFIRGYQFPVCARCFGVYTGMILAIILFSVVNPKIYICVLFNGIMFLDWWLQYKKILLSNNIRRVVTGLLAGYGLISIVIKVIFVIFNLKSA